jgi:BASS family bile acid:Na+ symporter
LLLGLLLFNAGLGIDRQQLARVGGRISVVPAAIVVGFVAPLTFVLLLGIASSLQSSTVPLHGLVLGLSVVAAMPAAGSSAAWSQNTNGNLALSVALILCSTVISPLTAWATLTVITSLPGVLDSGTTPDGLTGYAAAFLTSWVLLPAVAGAAVREVVGEARITRWRTELKAVNLVVLLVLNYANASLSLPAAISRPDWDFLALTFLASLALCAVNFWAGAGVARLLGVDRTQWASLVFATGMRNNGAGLVLVATLFPLLPVVMLPVITYNVLQHALAGMVSRRVLRPPS